MSRSDQRWPRTSELKHKIILCSSADVTIAGKALVLNRVGQREIWAAIAAKRGSFMTADGTVVKESREKPSHTVDIRYRTDLVYTVGGWIYERRLQSPPRWFKILAWRDLTEETRFTRFDVRLVTESDLARAPDAANSAPNEQSGPYAAKPLPPGVSL